MTKAAAQQVKIEANYWETLAIFWRLFWPCTLFTLSIGFVGAVIFGLVTGEAEATRLLNQWLVQFVAQQLTIAIALFLFMPLLTRWRYRHFQLVVVTNAGILSRCTNAQRFQLTVFVLWRWIVASLVAGLAVGPLTFSLALFGINLMTPITVIALIFGAGPMIARFLIGHQFPGFRLKIQRSRKS